MLTAITTRDRVARLAGLLGREREALVEFILELASFDRGRCWSELGYASLFDFLVRELGLSKGTAFYRMKAGELVQRFPEVIDPLRQGKLCITSIVELARVMTPENRAEVLPRFFHRSREEAKSIAAEIAPRAVVPLRVVVTEERPDMLSMAPSVERPAEPASGATAETTAVQLLNRFAPKAVDRTGEVAAPAHRDTAEPLTASLTRLHVTVSREFLRKLEAARLALSHSRPGASVEDVLEAGLELVLAKDAKKKALVDKPRARRSTRQRRADSAYIPAEVRREVWKRDQGCCQWKLASGGICGSKFRAELDHIIPRGRGGPSSVANLRVLCRRHNELAARLVYGDEHIDRFRRAGSPGSNGPPASSLARGKLTLARLGGMSMDQQRDERSLALTREDVRELTSDFRTSPDFGSFRSQLVQRGIDPATTHLACYYETVHDSVHGALVTQDERVFRFVCSPVPESIPEEWTIRKLRDITAVPAAIQDFRLDIAAALQVAAEQKK